MIVSSEGVFISKKVVATGALTAIVSTTGEAYRKKTIVKTTLRFIRKVVSIVRAVVIRFKEKVVAKFLTTKNGKPQTIEPPVEKL